MEQKIALVTVVVKEYDEAIHFYTGKMGFQLDSDISLSDTKRWVTVSPGSGNGCALLLAKADGKEQEKHIGDQTGGRVFLFLHTDDFWRDYGSMKQKGIHFVEKPREEAYGTVVVFEDLYGNRWDLLELKP